MKKKVSLHFGATSPNIADQLKPQGLNFDKKHVDLFQRRADAIILLRVGDLLPDSIHQKTTQKLFKQIQAHINMCNK